MSEGMSAGSGGGASAGAASSGSTGGSSTPASSASTSPNQSGANPGQSPSNLTNPGSQPGAGQAPRDTGGADPQASKPNVLGKDHLDSLVEVTINGQTQQLALKDVIRIQQTEQAALQRLEQAKRAHREFETRQQQFQQMAKENPAAFLKQMGIDQRQYAIDLLAKEYELQNMDPRERQLMEREERLKSDEQKQKEWQEARTKERDAHFLEQDRQSMSEEFKKAWEQTKLPKDPYFMQLAAAKVLASIKQTKAGLRQAPLQFAQAADMVKGDYFKTTQGIASQADIPTVIEMIGPKNVERLRQYFVEQATGKPAVPPPTEAKPSSTPVDGFNPNKGLGLFEHRAYVRRLAGQ